MILGNPWGLLALLSIPIILVLHMFRRRYRPKTVSSLFLFGIEEYNQASGRTRENIRRTSSLIAELIAALAITWFICDPHWNDYQQARHVICILDGHQRLQAIDADKTSAFQKSKRACTELLSSLADHDRVTLIASGDQPQLLTATAVPIPQASLALEKYQANQPYHDLQNSIEMAIDLQSASEQAQVVVFSDTAQEQLPDKWQCLSYGKAAANSGLTDARWFDDERGQRITLRIFRLDDKQQRSVQVFDEKQTLICESALKPQNGLQQIILPLPEKPTGILSIRLNGNDHYTIDDHCQLVKPPQQKIKVSVTSGMEQREHIIRALESTGKVQIVEDVAHIHIDNSSHQEQAGTWSVLIGKESGSAVIGPFLARSGHPLLQDLDFTGVLWGSPLEQLPSQNVSLLQAGNQCLISENLRDNSKLVYCHIDLGQSSIVRHPVWPSLFSNLVSWRLRYVPGLQHYHLNSQMSNRVVLPPGSKTLYAQFPNGEKQTFNADLQGIVHLSKMNSTGAYNLSLNEAFQPIWHSYIVHGLDQRSSNLSLCSTDLKHVPDTQSGKVQRIRTRLEHIIPLAIAILAALAAWFFYRREQGIPT